MRIQQRQRGVINPKLTICIELDSGTKKARLHSVGSNFDLFSVQYKTNFTCTEKSRTLPFKGDILMYKKHRQKASERGNIFINSFLMGTHTRAHIKYIYPTA